MSETTAPLAEAGAPTVAPEATPVEQTTPEAQATEAKAPEVSEADGTPEQPRGSDGKFLPKHPRVEKLQSTINDLTRQKHDVAREVARLREEAAQIQRQLAEKPQIDPTDFDALQAHQIRQAFKAEKLEDITKREQQLQAASQATTQQIIATQVETVREHIPDIDLIFAPPAQGGPMISPVMAEAIARTENGALVAYHLAKNPREAARLYSSDPATALIEIGRIAAQVSRPAPVKRVSQAPAPVQTVSGGPGNPQPDLGAMSFKDYERVMNERELARR